MNKIVRIALIDLCEACVHELAVTQETKDACNKALEALGDYQDKTIGYEEMTKRVPSLCDGDPPEDIDDCLEQALVRITNSSMDDFDDDDASSCLDCLKEAFDRAHCVRTGREYKG